MTAATAGAKMPKAKTEDTVDAGLTLQLEDAVLKKVGKPKGFSRIIARNVYGRRWRVNMYCEKAGAGEVMSTIHLSHSYFLTVSDKGEIVGSVPALP